MNKPIRTRIPPKNSGKCRKVGAPGGKSEAGDELRVVVKSAENFVISVADHDGAQGETHYEKSERLQAIEVAQGVSSGQRTHRLQQRSDGGKHARAWIVGNLT